jgi:subtilisin-like proprotein convertase family protein
MSRFRLTLVLACFLVPMQIPAVGPDTEPQSKLSPAMHHQLEEEVGPYRAWVFFTDKGLADSAARVEAIAAVAASYDPRAVERRRLRGRRAADGGLFDVHDLPVHEPYVEQVVRTGAHLRVRSRWVNAVSVEATGPQIDAIAALPAVTKIQPVARSRRPEFFESRAEEVQDAREVRELPLGSGALDYGRSTIQLSQINLVALHEAGYTGEGVLIGVLDTGFRRDHEAFNQPGHEIEVVAEYDFVDDDPDAGEEPGDSSFQHFHGTAILGTLASYYPGELVGGAFDASYALAKTEDTTGETPVEEDYYVAGLEFLEGVGVDMTTSSLGYIDWYTQGDLDGETAVTTIAINVASSLGVHTVTAAGNDGHDSDPTTSRLIAPADAFFVIAAGAVESSGSIGSFSADGPTADGRVKPELLAQGVDTETIDPYSTTAYMTANGTSMSTPLVAAAVACLIQAHPTLTVQEMRDALFRAADHDPGGSGFDPLYVRGYGIVDALETQANAVIQAGFVLFDDDVYSCSDTLVITLRDDNIPFDPPTVGVELSSTTETLPEVVTLTRIEPGLSRYQATFPTTSAPPVDGDGALSVSHDDVLYVEYTDFNDGNGGFGVTVQETASADCQPPVISGVQASEVTGASARIIWETDEPADSAVTYGLTPPGSTTETDGALVTSHDLRITGLEECSVHFYSVASADARGNGAVDDNSGAYYTLETGRHVNPSFNSTDTPLPIQDFATFDSVIAVTESEPVGDVDVTVDITHTFDGDVVLKLIPPTGPPITLVDRRGGDGANFENTVFDDEAATPIAEGSPPFAGSFRPETPLSSADGIDSLGNWKLRVSDQGLPDTGTLNSWTLSLTFAGQPCGPHASGGSHTPESDLCPSGGSGSGNGYWDAGEYVEFDMLVENDGMGPLTGVWAEVTPLTPGVVMLDWQASYPDLQEGVSSGSLAPHFAAKLPQGLVCGEPVAFAVSIHANEGSWTGGSVGQAAGEVIPGGGVALSEDFEGGLPGTWSVVDGFGDAWTWFVDNDSDPAGCSNIDPAFPIAGNWMAVDSDCTGPGTAMDEELISPPIDLVTALTAAVEFDHYFNANADEVAEVGVRSSLTGGNWVTVASWSGADTANPEHAVVDISAQAAGASDVQIRWRYYNADFEWYWYVDNVSVGFTVPSGCDMQVCTAAPTAPPPIPDGTGGSDPIGVEKLGGSQLRVSWDDQCSPVTAKILYGPLDGVATHGVFGAECGIAQPHVWSPVLAGDLWFVVVSEDGAGVEGSWGLASPANERNGLTGSGTCGSMSKDVSGTCP